MSTVLILTVGTTADPLVKTVEKQLQEDPDLRVYLLYGRPFPGQDPSPFDVATRVKERAAGLGVQTEPREAPDPEDLDSCLAAARAILKDAAAAGCVVVDFTGGTKPLSAAVVHAALTEPIVGQLVLAYTGGEVREKSTGRVLREAMRVRRTERTATEELLRQVLDLLRRFASREAGFLARRLPESGRAGFVRRTVDALYAWDEFDYQGSVQALQRLYEAARALRDDAELAPLAELCARLLEPGRLLVGTVQRLLVLQSGQAREWPHPDGMALMVADALENARRRLSEDRLTDGVLRAYRAVECAVHARLLVYGVNPWLPNWDQLDGETLRRYRERLVAPEPFPGVGARDPESVRLPRDLALSTGLKLVEVLVAPLPDELSARLRDLQVNRNHSYLEHGYSRVRREDAGRLLDHAVELCSHLLGSTAVTAARSRVSHHVWA